MTYAADNNYRKLFMPSIAGVAILSIALSCSPEKKKDVIEKGFARDYTSEQLLLDGKSFSKLSDNMNEYIDMATGLGYKYDNGKIAEDYFFNENVDNLKNTVIKYAQEGKLDDLKRVNETEMPSFLMSAYKRLFSDSNLSPYGNSDYNYILGAAKTGEIIGIVVSTVHNWEKSLQEKAARTAVRMSGYTSGDVVYTTNGTMYEIYAVRQNQGATQYAGYYNGLRGVGDRWLSEGEIAGKDPHQLHNEFNGYPAEQINPDDRQAYQQLLNVQSEHELQKSMQKEQQNRKLEQQHQQWKNATDNTVKSVQKGANNTVRGIQNFLSRGKKP